MLRLAFILICLGCVGFAVMVIDYLVKRDYKQAILPGILFIVNGMLVFTIYSQMSIPE